MNRSALQVDEILRFLLRLFLITLFISTTAGESTAQSRDIAYGVRLYQEGHYAEAEGVLGRVVGADSSLIELYPALVSSRFRLDQNDEALRLAEAGLRREPHHVLLSLLKVDLLLDDDRHEDALDALDRIIRRAESAETPLPEGVTLVELHARSGLLHHHMGVLKGDIDDWRQAAAHFELARKRRPDDVQVHRSLAYAHLQMAQWDALRDATGKGLTKFPDDDGLTRLRVRALAELNDTAALQEETERMYQSRPDDPQAGMTHAQVLLTAGRHTEAQAVFEEVLARHPNDRSVYEALVRIHRSMMNTGALIDVLGRMQTAFPTDPEIPYQIAAVHESRGDMEAARAVYDSLFVLQPSRVEPLLRTARTFEAEQQADHAIAVYEQILAQEPGHMEALQQLGVLFEDTGQWARARGCYERMLELGSRDVHVSLGRVNRAIGDRRLAQRHFERALGTAPRHPLPPLALARMAQEDGDMETAYAFAESALRLGLESVEREQRALMSRISGGAGSGFDGLEGRRARATDELDELDEVAAEAFAFLSGAFPRDRTEPVLQSLAAQYHGSGRLLYLMAQYYDAHGDEREAITQLRSAVRTTPALRDAHVLLAQLLERREDLAEAERAWERALSLDESDADAYEALIRIAGSTGREDQLIRRWEARLRAQPDNAVLNRYLRDALRAAGRDVDAVER